MNMTTMHIERFGQLGSQLADLHLKNLQDNNSLVYIQFLNIFRLLLVYFISKIIVQSDFSTRCYLWIIRIYQILF